MQDLSKEVKLCECGCGQPAPVAKQTNNKKGIKKGEPFRFIAGHNIARPIEKVVMKCEYCGTDKELQPSDAKRFRFCSRKCQGHYTRELTTNPVGSKYANVHGYVMVKAPDNPMNHSGYVLEHRLVMSEYLGRMLTPNEDVHHINGNKMDNRIENLRLLSRSEHTSLHVKEKWNTVFQSGVRTCRTCGKEKPIEGFPRKESGMPSTECRECYNIRRKEWRQKQRQ